MRADAPGSPVVTATVAADQAVPTPSNNSDSETTDVELSACSISFSGPFGTYPFNSTPFELTRGDFNEDGATDLVMANQSPTLGGVALVVNDGTGGFTESTFVPFEMQAWSLAVADFNGDDNLDVAAGAGSGRPLLSSSSSGTGRVVWRRPTLPIGAHSAGRPGR